MDPTVTKMSGEISYVLFGCVVSLLMIFSWMSSKKRQVFKVSAKCPSGEDQRKTLKGPTSYPLIGSLHKLGTPGGPFEAFTNMAKEYGDIYEIQLGVSKCVIVSSYQLIKEVLIIKGGDFGGRPDFLRFHELFGGDRNNCKYLFIQFFLFFYIKRSKKCLNFISLSLSLSTIQIHRVVRVNIK